MKIAIISDVHGNLEALKAVINDIKERNVDKIFCLGDTIAKGPHPKECIEIVKKECEIVLRGNCDRHFTSATEELNLKNELEIHRLENVKSKLSKEQIEYIHNLPYSFEFYLSGSLVRLFHATPEHDNVAIINQDSMEDKYKMFLPSNRTMSDKIADVIVYGHIHHQYMDKLYNKTILNTGSVGNSFCVIRNAKKDSSTEEIRRAHYCILEGKYGETEYTNEDFSIQFVKVPYEIEKELSQEEYLEKEQFIYELENATYRNMTKINDNFIRLGFNPEKF